MCGERRRRWLREGRWERRTCGVHLPDVGRQMELGLKSKLPLLTFVNVNNIITPFIVIMFRCSSRGIRVESGIGLSRLVRWGDRASS